MKTQGLRWWVVAGIVCRPCAHVGSCLPANGRVATGVSGADSIGRCGDSCSQHAGSGSVGISRPIGGMACHPIVGSGSERRGMASVCRLSRGLGVCS